MSLIWVLHFSFDEEFLGEVIMYYVASIYITFPTFLIPMDSDSLGFLSQFISLLTNSIDLFEK